MRTTWSLNLHNPPPHQSSSADASRRQLGTYGTQAEVALWLRLQRRQLLGRRLRRQHGIGPYVLDFHCPSEWLAVDLDGAVHDHPVLRAYDAERTRHRAAPGIRVVRFED